MSPEEYLDRLIDGQEYRKMQASVYDEDIAASLKAAKLLARLQEIPIPTDFSDHLELRVRAQARDFSQQKQKSSSVIRTWRPTSSHPLPIRRTFAIVLAAVVMLAIVGTGIISASASSLPGDPLYGLKQAKDQFAINFTTNPQDRANAQIDLLKNSLSDLNSVVTNDYDDQDIQQAIDTINTETNDSRNAVAALPDGPDRIAVQQNLDNVLTQEKQLLYQLLNHVDWTIRLSFTQQLGTLGEAVPTVTHATITSQNSTNYLIIVTGTNFASNAQLTIDGKPAGIVSQSTNNLLQGVINKAAWSRNTHTVGILNPDGTAAQTILKEDDQQQPGGDDNHHITPTPGNDSNRGATPTPASRSTPDN